MLKNLLKHFALSTRHYALLLALAMMSGCGPFWVDPYITVQDSSLNWVSIHYYNVKRRPIRKIAVTIYGNGHVEIRKGTGDAVSNDFAKRNDWDKCRVRQLETDPKHIHELMQNLVNYGLLDREKTGRSSSKASFDRFIAAQANINSNTYSQQENIFEVDPDLAEQLLDVVREFDNPAAY